MKKKIIAGIVLYNPTESNKKWIINLSKSRIFEKIILYSNDNKKYKDFFNLENMMYLSNGTNDGLAKAYNQMIGISTKENADFLCLLDQDSEYAIEEIKKIISFINSDYNFNKVAIVAPRSYPLNTNKIKARSKSISVVNYAINSGSFLDLENINKSKIKYDENIFLDGVDYDFGWQIREAGYYTILYEDSIFFQKLGYLKNKNDKIYHHNKFRYYLIAKNRKYIYKKHEGIVRGEIVAFLKNTYLMFEILLNEDDKVGKVRACLRGMLS